MISKAYKFRIYPNKRESEIIDNNFRINNFIYNYFLGIEIDTVDILKSYGLNNGKEKDEKYLNDWRTKHDLWFDDYKSYKIIGKMKKELKFDFLNYYPSSAIGYSLKSLKIAFLNINKTGAGFPKFKNKNSKNSYKSQIVNNTIPKFKLQKGKRYSTQISSPLNSPLKKVNIVLHNEHFLNNYSEMKFNSFTISKNKSGQYFISYQVMENVNVPKQKPIIESTSIGIDLGVIHPITISDDKFDNDLFSDRIEVFKKNSIELKKLQRILSKKRLENNKYKESKKYLRIKNKINKLHNKISNQRSWIQNNITKKLVDIESVDTFVLEELNIKGMTKKTGKGKSNNKSGLNRVMLDVGISEIINQLEYKSAWSGKNVVTINPMFTSQRCNSCGYINKENRKTQETFKCLSCGHTDNADKNASKNIKDKFFNKNY